jgi:hypothetical protein
VISASSEFGVNGTVTSVAERSGSGQVRRWGKTPLSRRRCSTNIAHRWPGEFSNFTVAGRDSLPRTGQLAHQSAGDDERRHRAGDSPAEETPLLSLRQIAPAGFLTQAFALDWSTGCAS